MRRTTQHQCRRSALSVACMIGGEPGQYQSQAFRRDPRCPGYSDICLWPREADGPALRRWGFCPARAACIKLSWQGNLDVCVGRVGAPRRADPVQAANGSCVSFRQTGGCSGRGPEQLDGDRPCSAVIPCHSGECPSGHCECKGGIKRHPVSCKVGSHAPFSCEQVCSAPDSSVSMSQLPAVAQWQRA